MDEADQILHLFNYIEAQPSQDERLLELPSRHGKAARQARLSLSFTTASLLKLFRFRSPDIYRFLLPSIKRCKLSFTLLPQLLGDYKQKPIFPIQNWPDSPWLYSSLTRL